jgi:hypothetical protein
MNARQPRSFRAPLPRTHLENDNRGDSHEDRHRRRYKDECALRLNHDDSCCGSGPVTSPPGTQHFAGPNKMSAGQVTLSHVSTKDQVLSSELHGEALLTARRPELQPLIDHLREVAQGRDDIRVECAGILAGSRFSSTARRGEDLIAAGSFDVGRAC